MGSETSRSKRDKKIGQFVSLKQLLAKGLNVGDIIEFNSYSISHFAIYIGAGEIVHLLKIKGKAKIIRETLINYYISLMDTSCRINNLNFSLNGEDLNYKPLPTNEIIKNALEKVGESYKYSLLFSNCEHFVFNARYGWHHAMQPLHQTIDYVQEIFKFEKPKIFQSKHYPSLRSSSKN